MTNHLREERIKKQLTQAELAAIVGVSRQTYISVEANRYTPSVILSMKLAKALGKKVEDIFVLEVDD